MDRVRADALSRFPLGRFKFVLPYLTIVALVFLTATSVLLDQEWDRLMKERQEACDTIAPKPLPYTWLPSCTEGSSAELAACLRQKAEYKRKEELHLLCQVVSPFFGELDISFSRLFNQPQFRGVCFCLILGGAFVVWSIVFYDPLKFF